ncbi:DBH-like monooxygenase protein 1 homolog [Dreissena polymorpha]|uniref:DOMON domain-containing protein n=1 Tax=Dreissena polymorpha TaxID=45954 RepID=A0A9D4RD77_DREPO|nr:DBH-like monooxygenase protein 1 homolog [Dreissena polymorpha]KAH3863954.1 hypothetical protein DPMN_026962 [Dreissena polymorpha]
MPWSFLFIILNIWSAVNAISPLNFRSLPGWGAPSQPSTTENYDFHEILDENQDFHVHWNVDHEQKNITFELHVRTHGYVGFGISHNGKMFPADIVIGWVKDEQIHFKDRHAVALEMPLVDSSQDWHLLYGAENTWGTVLKVTRLLDTCDPDDYTISDDTVHLLYAYHPDDPADDNNIPFHGSRRHGSKSISLTTKMTPPELPSDVQYIDWMNGKVLVPNKETYYRCKTFTFDQLHKKHHLVRVEPRIQKGHENLIHHIIVYKCADVDRKFLGIEYECYMQPNTQLYPCSAIMFGWEFSGNMDYPEHAGLPIAEPDDDAIYIMETHYNNPELVGDIVDDSGIRIYYTPTLRQYDAGVLMTGIPISPLQVVPPLESHFTTTGFCHRDCLNQELQNRLNSTPIRIFAVWQHSHKMAFRLRTRHFRNGVELEPLADDANYDWNYQGFRYLKNNTTMEAGDEFVYTCHYNSMKKRTAVFGGPSTTDEMCFSLIFYYPRIGVESCQATPLFDGSNTTRGFINELNPQYPWGSEEARAKFKKSLVNSKYRAHCHGEKRSPKWEYVELEIPKPTVPYIPPQSDCPEAGDGR